MTERDVALWTGAIPARQVEAAPAVNDPVAGAAFRSPGRD